MRLWDSFGEAFANLRGAKLRSFLTSLGIIIGISSVVMMISIGQGVRTTVTGAFAGLGTTQMTVYPSPPRGGGGGPPFAGFGGFASTLSLEDAAVIAGLEGVAAVAPVIVTAASLQGPAASVNLSITGTTPDFAEVARQTLVAGRMFEQDDEIVLNQSAARQLFAEEEAVGGSVNLRGGDYVVAGVFANMGSPFAQLAADEGEEVQASPAAFIPITPALALAGTDRVAQIVLTAQSPELVEPVSQRVRRALLERRDGVRDFRIGSFQELLDSFSEIFNTLTLFLAAIAGISLLVGGIGIMNIMLVTVTERTREIGIAKAIGATRRDVVTQFLIEAVLLSLLGGVLGLLLAWLGTLALNTFFDLPALITWQAVGLAVGVSAVIGVFFGVFPAWRAARLDPIVALRHQ